nr:hypothetical protein [Candidatus Sigynarchaeota archaeon]
MTTMDIIAFGWTIVALCVSILASVFVLHYIEQNVKKPDKRFTISQQFIEIARWDRKVFHVEWSSVTSINILKEDRGDSETSLVYYTITFEIMSSPRTIKFDAITDFSPQKIDCFVYFLVQFARQRNVPISGIEKGMKRIPFIYPKYERELGDWKIFKNKELEHMWNDFSNELRNCF